MKRFLTICISCISLFYACKPGVPKDIIQPAQMEKILFDIHIVDGYIGSLSLQDTAKIVASRYYKAIYKKFNIDSATYNKSMDYYYDHADVLEKMYSNLSKRFQKEVDQNNLMTLKQEQDALKQKTDFKALSTQPSNRSGKVVTTNPFSFNTPYF